MSYPEYVEANDVHFNELVEIKIDGQFFLRVSGLIFHSCIVVKAVEVIKTAGVVKVLVHLLAAGKGLSGTFAYDVPLPRQGCQVVFGPAETAIWPRREA